MKIISWIGSCGALMVSEEIPGVTQELSGDLAISYGGKHFICETITTSAAKAVSKAMGWEFTEVKL